MVVRLFLALVSAALVALPAVAPAQQRPAAQRDWTRTVVRTPEGGFRMGNPNAPVKVIEYLSLACPHCAEFARESATALHDNHVRSGRVSIEYRNIVISLPDIPAAVLARCAAPGAFFALSHELMRTQSQWIGRARALPAEQQDAIRTLPPSQMAQRLAPLIGLDRIAARHGLDAAAQRACLSNQANFDRLESLAATANSQFGVTGTPTFVINGRVAETNVWAGIEPLLRPGG